MFAGPVPVLALVSLFAGAVVFPPVLPAQDSSARGPVPATPRTLRFSTDEGTGMGGMPNHDIRRAALTEIWPRQRPLARLWWETPAVNAGAP